MCTMRAHQSSGSVNTKMALNGCCSEPRWSSTTGQCSKVPAGVTCRAVLETSKAAGRGGEHREVRGIHAHGICMAGPYLSLGTVQECEAGRSGRGWERNAEGL